MKNAKRKLFCFFFFGIGFLGFCQTFNFSGKLVSEAGVALPYTKNAWDFVLAQLSLDSQLSFYAGNNSLFVDSSLSFDSLSLMQEEAALKRISGAELYSFSLNEAYYAYEGSWFLVRVGRQMASWGVADGITVSDVICPDNLINVFASDLSESKLAIDALKVSLFAQNLILDAYWIPFFTPAQLPQSVTGTLKNVSLPELTLSNGEYAIRMSGYFSFADFSVYGYYGWDDIPLVSYNLDSSSQSVLLSGEYKRFCMLGLDSSIPIKQVTVRLETAFFPMRYFAKSAENQLATNEHFQQNNQLLALLGLDWMYADLTLSAQYCADFAFGEIAELDRELFTQLVTLQGSYSLLGGNLSISLGGIVHLEDFDSAVFSRIEYSVTDNLSLSGGVNIFIPGIDEKGTFSAYKDLSCIVIKGILRF